MLNKGQGVFKTILIILIYIGFQSTIYCQFLNDIPAYKNGEYLENPWVGGFNNPQFSEADLDFDGINELVVFDRSANTVSAFKYQDEKYYFSQELSTIFPSMINFCLVRDYNADGIPDLFTYSFPDPASGIKVFRGVKNSEGKLEFISLDHNNGKFPNVLHYQGNSNKVNVYCAVSDIPVIDDIDGDGDIDILAFEPSGGRISYFRNMSNENSFGADSLIFIRQDVCWGKILEGPTFDDIILSSDPNACANHLDPITESRHAGSNILTIDQNNDGLLDLLITDIDVTEIKLLINNGSTQNAWISELINDFPPELPVDVNFFPASFSIDVNRDGKNDLVFSPGMNSIFAESVETAWYYENMGPEDNQQFSWRQNDFLSSTMLDFGYGTVPTVVDVTGDGLLDIVVGVHAKFYNGEVEDFVAGHLVLLVNIGSAEEPQFVVEDEDWLGFGMLEEKILGPAPTFGDLDGDGDLDLLIGTSEGTLILMENIAGKGRSMRFANPQFEAFGIVAGRNAVPSIADVNKNGLLDILIGENLGSLTLFQNTGTTSEAKFSSSANDLENIPFFAGIDVRENPVPGAAAPFFFQSEGKSYISTGRTDKGVLLYQNNGDFQNYEPQGLIPNTNKIGRKSAGVLADLNNNGKLEMILGNIRGGLSIVATEIPSDERLPVNPDFNDKLLIFPNPTSDAINILYLNAQPIDVYTVEILSTSGLVVDKKNDVNLFGEYVFDLSQLSDGVYFVKVQGLNKTIIEKIVKI